MRRAATPAQRSPGPEGQRRRKAAASPSRAPRARETSRSPERSLIQRRDQLENLQSRGALASSSAPLLGPLRNPTNQGHLQPGPTGLRGSLLAPGLLELWPIRRKGARATSFRRRKEGLEGSPRAGQGKRLRNRDGVVQHRCLSRLACTRLERVSWGGGAKVTRPTPPHLAPGAVPGSCVRRAGRPATQVGFQQSHAKREGSQGRGS